MSEQHPTPKGHKSFIVSRQMKNLWTWNAWDYNRLVDFGKEKSLAACKRKLEELNKTTPDDPYKYSREFNDDTYRTESDW